MNNSVLKLFLNLTLFICIYFYSSFNSISQNPRLDKKISILVEDITIVNMIQLIEYESGVSFSYNSRLITDEIHINIDVDNRAIRDVLNLVFNQTNLEYKELNNVIVIYRPRKLHSDIKDGIIDITVTNSPEVTVLRKTRESIDQDDEAVTNNDQSKIWSKIEKVGSIDFSKIKSDQNQISELREMRKKDAKVDYYDMMKSTPFYRKLYYELNIYGGVNYIMPYSSSSLEDSYSDTYYEQVSFLPGTSYGVNASVFYHNQFIKSGVNLSMYKEKLNQESVINNISSLQSFYDQPTTITIWKEDEGYEQIIGYDTIWVVTPYEVDTTVLRQTVIINMDTNSININKEYINKRFYLEIPLIYGKRVHIGKIASIDFQAGLITSFLLYNKVNFMISEYDMNLTDHITSKYYLSTQYSLFLSPALDIQLTKDFGMTLSSYARLGLRTIYSDHFPIQYKDFEVGFRMGLTYYF